MTTLALATSEVSWRAWVLDYQLMKAAGVPAIGNPLYEFETRDGAWAACDLMRMEDRHGA